MLFIQIHTESIHIWCFVVFKDKKKKITERHIYHIYTIYKILTTAEKELYIFKIMVATDDDHIFIGTVQRSIFISDNWNCHKNCLQLLIFTLLKERYWFCEKKSGKSTQYIYIAIFLQIPLNFEIFGICSKTLPTILLAKKGLINGYKNFEVSYASLS